MQFEASWRNYGWLAQHTQFSSVPSQACAVPPQLTTVSFYNIPQLIPSIPQPTILFPYIPQSIPGPLISSYVPHSPSLLYPAPYHLLTLLYRHFIIVFLGKTLLTQFRRASWKLLVLRSGWFLFKIIIKQSRILLLMSARRNTWVGVDGGGVD